MHVSTDQIETIEIPFKKLEAWSENVRTTATTQGIEELAASIASVGLLQSLVVRREPRGKFAVVAGRRRLVALSRLFEDGKIKANLPIPCRVVDPDTDLTEISLAENVVRENLHPADEVEAFSKLLASGQSAADIAARFGVSEAVVLKRLALARVSPALLQQYREGVLTLEILQAFTLTDDQTLQEHVWNQLHSWDRTAQAVRRLLSQDDIAATDKRVRFVGLAIYEAHGGTLRRDLFANDEQGVYIQDAVLLNRLVSEKLAALASTLHAEGWKWVEIQPEQNYQFAARLRRLPAQWEPLSPKRQARLDALQAEQAELEAQLSANDSEEADEDDPRYIRLNQLDSAIAQIEDKRKEVYPAETKALSGVVVAVDWNGNAHYTYGLLKREDEVALAQPPHESTTTTTSSAVQPIEETEDAYSAPLVEKLSQHKTAAIAAELMRQPQIALVALVHGLVLSGFGLDLQLYRSETSIQISTTEPHLEAAETGPAFTMLQEQRQAWMAQFPKTSGELWHWCLELAGPRFRSSCVNAIYHRLDLPE